MGRYTVLTPCVVGELHYAQIPGAPIEADDTLAAALVAAGVLAPADDDDRGVAAEPSSDVKAPVESSRKRRPAPKD